MRYDRQTANTWLHYGTIFPSFFPYLNSLSLLLFFTIFLPHPPPHLTLAFSFASLCSEDFQTRQYVMFETPLSPLPPVPAHLTHSSVVPPLFFFCWFLRPVRNLRFYRLLNFRMKRRAVSYKLVHCVGWGSV